MSISGSTHNGETRWRARVDAGIAACRTGRYAEAESELKQAVAEVLHTDARDPRLAHSINALAELYRVQGLYAKAEPLYRRALALYEGVGVGQPAVICMNNLAELYLELGQHDQAEPLFKLALAMSEKLLGMEHPDVAMCLSDLAEVYSRRGEYDQAAAMDKRALDICRKAFGPKHPEVARICRHFVSVSEKVHPRKGLGILGEPANETEEVKRAVTLAGRSDATQKEKQPDGCAARFAQFLTGPANEAVRSRSGPLYSAMVSALFRLNADLFSDEAQVADYLDLFVWPPEDMRAMFFALPHFRVFPDYLRVNGEWITVLENDLLRLEEAICVRTSAMIGFQETLGGLQGFEQAMAVFQSEGGTPEEFQALWRSQIAQLSPRVRRPWWKFW